jgi:hypothetical protein
MTLLFFRVAIYWLPVTFPFDSGTVFAFYGRILEDLLCYFCWCSLVPSFETWNDVIASGTAIIWQCCIHTHQNCFGQPVDREYKRMNVYQIHCRAANCGILWTLHIAEPWNSDSASRTGWT